MELEDLKFFRLVQGGRKPHYIFEQDKHYYVLTLQDYETRGNFLVLSKTEVDKVKKELLQQSIPNPFNTSDIFKLIKEVNSQYLDKTSENYEDYYIHRLTCICYVLEALKFLTSVKDGRKFYFYKHPQNTIKKKFKPKQETPIQSIIEKVENLKRENRKNERSTTKTDSQEEIKVKIPTKNTNENSKILSSSEIIQQKLEEIERNKNHGLPLKPMVYNNFINNPNTEKKKLFNYLQTIGKKVNAKYSYSQFHALIGHYGFAKVKKSILHDISKIKSNHRNLKLKVPLMVNNLPKKK